MFQFHLQQFAYDTLTGAASRPPVAGPFVPLDGDSGHHHRGGPPRRPGETGRQIPHLISRAERLYHRDDLPEALASVRAALEILHLGGNGSGDGAAADAGLHATAAKARLLRIKILMELRQWQETGEELRRIDPSIMDVWQKAEIALGWAAYSNATGAAALAAEWIATARQLIEVADRAEPETAPERRCELWLALAETAMVAAPTLVPGLLDQITLFEADMTPPLAARCSWIRCRWNNQPDGGRELRRPDYLRRFVTECEKGGLVGLLARAVRREPDIFVNGMAHGISSSFYPVFFPPLSEANLKRLSEVATDERKDASVRMTAFQVISRQPAHEAALTTAETLVDQGKTGGLRDISMDFLGQSEADGLRGTAGPGSISLQTFGGFRMVHRGRDIAEEWRVKAKLLLLLLMFQGSRPLRRGRAQDLLWPDLERSAQSNNLRVTLHWLRRALGSVKGPGPADSSNGARPSYPAGSPLLEIDASRSSITLSGVENVAWDVRLFDEMTGAGRRMRREGKKQAAISSFRRAVGLYKGTLLPHRAFEGFFDLERSHYHRLAHETMVDLAELYLDTGSPDAALEITDRAIQMEPLHENTWALAIRSHLEMGFPGRAKEAYERFASLAHRELGTLPGPGLQKLTAHWQAG